MEHMTLANITTHLTNPNASVKTTCIIPIQKQQMHKET
ncbi:unnamed protein product, partial [Rotaria sp. Silwood2]